MLKPERPYEFRDRIDHVHHWTDAALADPVQPDEIQIGEGWKLSWPADASETVRMAADDLLAYFRDTFGVALAPCPGGDKGIVLRADDATLDRNSYLIDIKQDTITLAASGDRLLRRACIALEDACNLRGAPVLKLGATRHEKLVTPRMVHSGWGIELFPDAQLNAILHAGFDAIMVFTRAPDRTNIGVLDFSDLIRRAAKYDIDFYFYSYLPSFKHPDEPDAQEFFENVFTRLFERYPGAAGIMVAGESAEFPSKDPATTGRQYKDSWTDGIRDVKPSPGWWPCSDYPAWLTCVRDAVRKGNPNARVIFNTYNWCWAPLDVRRRFLEGVPEGVTIQITFDIQARRDFFGLVCPAMDYSIGACEPGYYFDTEIRAAAALGLPVLSTANTAGTTWDFGDVPYMPVPQRWIRRFKALDRYRRECNLDAFYDCHHYGWWPSVITELGKAYFNAPQVDLEAHLASLARRWAGEGDQALLAAWQLWSDAFDYLPATNEDQYGPLRVGPSYPFIFQPNITRTMSPKEIKFPTMPGAHFGNAIIFTLYQPYESAGQPPAFLRYPVEIRALERFLQMWDAGLAKYGEAIAAAPASRREPLERECNMGRFIRAAAQTTLNIKRWWQLNHALQVAESAEDAEALLDRIEALAKAEIENARAAIPLVEVDSRLGWEPSMEYVCDRWHLEWKIRQMESALLEIAEYRGIVKGASLRRTRP